jgi:rare lipoprotein A (peptidoglycan hydrolase)
MAVSVKVFISCCIIAIAAASTGEAIAEELSSSASSGRSSLSSTSASTPAYGHPIRMSYRPDEGLIQRNGHDIQRDMRSSLATAVVPPPIRYSNPSHSVTMSRIGRTGARAVHGVASWYGRKFHGRKTANGEVYNMYAHTAAHKTLPFGTVVRVTNLRNGRQAIVRINDRGPFVEGRDIDLSFRAAHDLGMVDTGVEKVRLELLSS